MGNRQTSSLNNVGIGVDTLKGDADPAGYTYSTGSRNTAIGNYALMQQGSGNDNVAIGYQALQLTGLERVNGGLGVTPNRCVAIGAGSQKTNIYGSDNISIGYNCFPNNGGGTRNILLGSNAGVGLAGRDDNVIIGSNCMGTASDNGIVCIGSGAMQFATGSVNRGTFVGSDAGRNNANGQLNTFIGNSAGIGNASGSQNVCLGTFAGRLSLATGIYMTCIGYDSNCVQSNEFSIGSDTFAERAELTLPNKTRLACNQSQTGTTITLSFRTNENVLLTDATTTTINLPTPNTDGRSEGCKFYINRKVAGVGITINAPSGQTIAYYQSNATYTSAGSYFLNAAAGSITFLCVGSTASGANWQAIPPTISQATDSIYLGTTNPYSTSNLSITFGGTTTPNYHPLFIDNANLNYKQSTATLTATNITSSGTIAGTTITGTAITGTNVTASTLLTTNNMQINGTFTKGNYQPYKQSQLLSTATVLPNLPTIAGLYYFISATAATTITLPTITPDMLAQPISFRRLTNASFALIIKTPSGSGNTIVQRGSITETATNVNYTLLSTTEFNATIVPITITQWAVLI